MRIAFYAPLKAPDHPVPSGDRLMARLLMSALRKQGNLVELTCRFRSRDDLSEAGRLRRLREIGGAQAARIARRLLARPAAERPVLWLTYHIYYKAPDWIGPTVSDALGIPYVVAEASHAPKRADGPWSTNHRDVAFALARAERVIGLNSHDRACVAAALADPDRQYRGLRPFTDTAPFVSAAADRVSWRRRTATRFDLDPTVPWLLAVGMMRPGDKAASYGVLAEAMARLTDRPWTLLVVGDGSAREAVEAAFANRLGDDGAGPDRLRRAGVLPQEDLAGLYAAADLFVWPAINEAYGMALLEAQSAGLPAVAGRSGGVADILRHGETGLLVPPGDVPAFADAVARLLDDPDRRRCMAATAAATTAVEHDIGAAGRQLDSILREAVADHAAHARKGPHGSVMAEAV